MILDLAELIEQYAPVLLPENCSSTDLQVAFLHTTDPTFLIFKRDQKHPFLVAKIGSYSALEPLHGTLQRLYALMPEFLAQPLGVYKLEEDMALSLQEGLPGTPWFSLARKMRTEQDWIRLRSRATGTLNNFHDAVSSNPNFSDEPYRFGSRMRTLTQELFTTLNPLGAAALITLHELSEVLDVSPPRTAYPQHCDFVLNNLLIDADRVYIIDFGEFGNQRVPLLDAFALGSSINSHASTHVDWCPLAEDLAICTNQVSQSIGMTAREKTAYYGLYLLIAVSDTVKKSVRGKMKFKYVEKIHTLVNNLAEYDQAFKRYN